MSIIPTERTFRNLLNYAVFIIYVYFRPLRDVLFRLIVKLGLKAEIKHEK